MFFYLQQADFSIQHCAFCVQHALVLLLLAVLPASVPFDANTAKDDAPIIPTPTINAKNLFFILLPPISIKFAPL